jgi:hypothetical protein
VEEKKVSEVAWRKDDFEEHFDPLMFASGGANNWITEKKGFPGQRIFLDVVVPQPHGKIGILEAKPEPKVDPKYMVLQLYSWNAIYPAHENLIKVRQHLLASLIHTGILLSRPLIDEPSHQEEPSAPAFSAAATLWEDEDLQNGAAVHPLTKSAYRELPTIPKSQRNAIQFVLNQLAIFLPKGSSTMRPFRLTLLEDSSYLLEWTFADRRLGFSFESNPDDSGWYYVYSSGSSERYESGTMDQLEVSRLVAMTLKP